MTRTEQATTYAARWGLSLEQGCELSDFLQVMESLCRDGKGYFIFKIDGERSHGIYTLALNLGSARDLVFRTDIDRLADGIEHLFAELERHGVYP